MQRELTLLLRTLYDERGARAVLSDLGRLQQALHSSEQSAQRASSTLQALFAGGVGGAIGAGLITALGTIQNLLGSITGLAESYLRGIVQASMQMEQMRFGLATVLGAWNEVRNAQGQVLTGAERYNALLALSTELMQQIRAEANRTILETQELTELVQTGLGYAYARGLTPQQAIQVISAIGQAGKMMGLTGPMLVQEVRAILGGGRIESAQVAQAFGITQEMLQKRGDELAQALLRALASVTEAAEVAAERLDVQWSTITSQIQDAMAQMGDGIRSGLTELLAGLNASLQRLIDSGVFRQIGAFLGLLFQGLLELGHAVVEGIRQLWGLISGWVDRFWTGLTQLGRMLGLDRIVSALPKPLRDVLSVATPVSPLLSIPSMLSRAWEGLRAAWDVAGLLTRTTPPQPMFEIRPRAPQTVQQRARATRQKASERAERIRADIEGKRYEEAWTELVEMLDPENAAALEPILSAIEQQIAELRAAEILAQIRKDTDEQLRQALAMQAEYEYERTLRGLVGRRAERLTQLRRARAHEQQRQQEAVRQQLRAFYQAVGLEQPRLQMEYEALLSELLSLGVSPIWATLMAGAQVYLPAWQRRAERQAELKQEFEERLRQAAARAQQEQLQSLIRRFRAGLLTPEQYARELRRLAGTRPVEEAGLSALEAGLREEVLAGLPSARTFEAPEAFRARWLMALQEMKTYWGQLLEGLLHPQQYARVMEMFDALGIEFDKRFVRKASGRWSEFVEGLVSRLASGVREAFVGLLELVMADFRRLGEGLRGFFEGIVGMIRRAIAELIYERAIRAWVERLMDWLEQRLGVGDGVEGGGGRRMSFWGVLGSIALGAFTSWLGGIVGGWLGRIFRFQQGGTLLPYRLALVGEHGPELLLMGTGAYGTVYPTTLLRQLHFAPATPQSLSITVQVSDISEVGLARRVATEVRRILRERGV